MIRKNIRGSGRMTRRLGAVTLAVAAALVLASCTGAPADGGGDAITIAVPDEPTTLAAWNAVSATGTPILRNVEEALLNRDPVTNELVGELATSWTLVDPTTWEFKLREGVTFQDGSPFNAEAAAYALNEILSPENAYIIRIILGPDITATAVDDYTLRVATATPDPILPTRLYFVTIPSMKQLQDDPSAWETHPIGTGPYTFVEWQRGSSITLEANENWWGRDAADAGGDNTDIDKVTVVFRKESEVRASAVKTGEAQIGRFVTAEQCADAPVCKSSSGVETMFLRLDTPNPALADERVRRAIALSLDKDQIMESVVGGGPVAVQMVGSGALGFNSDLKPYPYDPDEAAKLIAEAVADGVSLDTPLTVVARADFIVRADELIQVVADAVKSLGFTHVESKIVEGAAFEEAWGAGLDSIDPDRGWIAVHQHGNELMDFASTVYSYNTCDGPQTAFCDPKVDEMYNAAVELSGDERDKALQEIAAYLYDKVYTVPIGQPNFNFALAENLDWTPRYDGFLLVKEMSFQ